jgi:hypothetical protein
VHSLGSGPRECEQAVLYTYGNGEASERRNEADGAAAGRRPASFDTIDIFCIQTLAQAFKKGEETATANANELQLTADCGVVEEAKNCGDILKKFEGSLVCD